ncbi:bifunctional metallophosphatase/5'-nucleotidase [Neolewinella antarctica]|uniref:5'-nucleotidase n=1 Tax=Neolewinella antarctica TaxID=442734 RepID=A0ABX0X7J6_9BACT|nr:metallophosphatase [Neolewinella antarctica]NJC25193.1 5'-nucleotidase [Neolewinella antarctica]
MNRRFFIRRAAVGGGVLLVPGLATAAVAPSTRKLTILHTNDWHSRIDPFPDDGGRNANQGGAIRRMRLIEDVRRQEQNVILLDSGDIFQGTPYFNFFAGELEMKLMTKMGYDAATIGNHDFDGGMENLATQLTHAKFPMLSANYEFAGTPLAGQTQPYTIIKKNGVKVGVFGVGIELQGLVPEKLYGRTNYLEPTEVANRTAAILRHREKCDVVICLSHLGFRYRGDKVDDIKLAAASKDIDIILGGHTHTFLDAPVEAPNAEGVPVIVNQVGFGGLRVGRLDLTFPGGGARSCVACNNLRV